MLRTHRETGAKLTAGKMLLLLAMAAVPMALALSAEPTVPDGGQDERHPLAESVVVPTPSEATEITELAREPVATGSPARAVGGQPLSLAAQRDPTVKPLSDAPIGQLDRPATTAPRPLSETRKRVLFQLNNAPALDVAATINALFEGERKAGPDPKGAPDVVISTDLISNCILVSASPSDVAQIERILQTLDAPESMVRIQMLIAQIVSRDGRVPGEKVDASTDTLKQLVELGVVDRLANSDDLAKRLVQLRGSRELKIISRPQIMTLDNQPAFVRVGGKSEGKVTKGKAEEVLVGVTPRTATDGTVIMEIDVDITRPRTVTAAIVATDSSHDRPAPVKQLISNSTQTTISVADGETILLGGVMPNSDTPDEELLVVLTPKVVLPTEQNSAEPASAQVISSPPAKTPQ